MPNEIVAPPFAPPADRLMLTATTVRGPGPSVPGGCFTGICCCFGDES